MIKRACIYCGTTEKLSESDIIPDALTNCKVINPNVCATAHNNKFSDEFEWEIIDGLAAITNHMNICSSKSKKFATYSSIYTIDGENYTVRDSSYSGMLHKKIVSSTDGTKKIGPYDRLKKFSNINENDIQRVNLNTADITKLVSVDLQLFFSLSMYRLIAKIAFEWYCQKNNVCGKLNDFDKIINFITTGSGTNPVEMVENEEFYSLIDSNDEYGTHTIFSYIGLDNSVNIIVDLFGIVIYNVKLLSAPIVQCKNNAVFQKLFLNSKRIEFKYEDPEQVKNSIYENTEKTMAYGFMILTSVDSSVKYKIVYSTNYTRYQREAEKTKEPNKKAINLLNNHIQSALFASALTLKGLKRYANEIREIVGNTIILNPMSKNPESTFLLYLFYSIGKPDTSIFSIKDLNNYVRKKFDSNCIKLTNDYVTVLNQEMLSEPEYAVYINKGIDSVLAWTQ